MDCTELLFKGVMKCTCPWDPPPLPPPKKKKKTAIVCLNKTEAKSLSLVGRLEAKFWIFFSCFVYRWLYVVGINRVIQLFKITLFPPPPPTAQNTLWRSNFFVPCTTSYVISVTDNLAFTCPGGKWVKMEHGIPILCIGSEVCEIPKFI